MMRRARFGLPTFSLTNVTCNPLIWRCSILDFIQMRQWQDSLTFLIRTSNIICVTHVRLCPACICVFTWAEGDESGRDFGSAAAAIHRHVGNCSYQEIGLRSQVHIPGKVVSFLLGNSHVVFTNIYLQISHHKMHKNIQMDDEQKSQITACRTGFFCSLSSNKRKIEILSSRLHFSVFFYVCRNLLISSEFCCQGVQPPVKRT